MRAYEMERATAMTLTASVAPHLAPLPSATTSHALGRAEARSMLLSLPLLRKAEPGGHRSRTPSPTRPLPAPPYVMVNYRMRGAADTGRLFPRMYWEDQHAPQTQYDHELGMSLLRSRKAICCEVDYDSSRYAVS